MATHADKIVGRSGIIAAGGGQTVRSIVFDLSRRNRWLDPYTGRVPRNRHTERWLGREDELEAAAEQVGRDYAMRASAAISI